MILKGNSASMAETVQARQIILQKVQWVVTE